MPALEKRLKKTRERAAYLRFLGVELRELSRILWAPGRPRSPSECSMLNARIRFFRSECSEMEDN